MTPRKPEVPLAKPWDWRLTALMSSSRVIASMFSVRSEYLFIGGAQHYRSCSAFQGARILQVYASLTWQGAKNLQSFQTIP